MNALPSLDNGSFVPTPFGRAARPLWLLRADGSFLNHGSYGAIPRAVRLAHDRVREQAEAHPDAFMQQIKPDADGAVRAVAARIAAYVGTNPNQLALTENATSSVQAVVNGMPLQPGDQVLITNHQYDAVRLGVEARCRQSGAEPVVVHIPLPTSEDDILERILALAGPRVRLAVLDHITSPTALTFPIAQLARELQRRGVPVCVDGAHAIGQIPLDLAALDCEWYVSNLHKWMYAPRGTAFLHAAERVRAQTRPLVTSHFASLGFPVAFDYVGTRDYTGWLAAPAAMDFHASLDETRLWAYERELVAFGSAALAGIGAEPIAPLTLAAAMRTFRLPQTRRAEPPDAIEVSRALWEQARIQVRCMVVDDQLLLRFCAQAYVAKDELTQLAETLQRLGWPARR